jgi:hypothetical protein
VTLENSMHDGFKRKIKYKLGKFYNELSFKTKAMFKDLRAIRVLLDRLLNQDCVTFYWNVRSLKSRHVIKDDMSKYSIFRHSDSETAEVIQKLSLLAKERVYVVINKKFDSEDLLDDKLALTEIKSFESLININD